MKRLLSVFWVTLIVGVTLAQAGGKLQNEDFKSVADLIAAGSNQSHLLNDTKIYITANGLNQQLSTAISAGLIGGSSGGGGGIQLLANPGAEVDVNHITDTIPADLTRTTVSANVLFGQGSFSLLASAAETVTWDAVTIPTGLYGQSCAASLVYKGNAVGYTMRVEDGSGNILASQALSNQSSPTTQLLSFICPGSGTMKLQIVTTGSAAQIYFDNAILGTSPLTSQVNQAYLVGTVQIPSLMTCDWFISSAASNIWADFAAVSGCNNGIATGSLQPASTKIPGFQAALPQGHYLILVTGAFYSGSTGVDVAASIYNGTDRSFDMPTSFGKQQSLSSIQGNHIFNMDVTDSSLQTYRIQAYPLDNIGTPEISNDLADATSLSFSVYRYPTQSELVVNPATTANSWSGYHDGDCDWLTSSSTFADPTPDSSCTFVQRTNTNFGTVSSYNNGTLGTNYPGIVFTPSRLGKYVVCAGINPIENSGGSANYNVELSDLTPTVVATLNTGTVTASQPQAGTICGQYQALSTAPVTLRLRMKTGSGTVEIGAGGAGNPAVEWSIFQADQQFPMPVLVGGVVSDTQGVEKIERAHIAGDGSCTVVSQSGNWITSTVNGGTGTCTLNISAGIFSVAPDCVVTGQTNSAAFVGTEINPPVTSTSVEISTTNTGGAASDLDFNIICMGQH